MTRAMLGPLVKGVSWALLSAALFIALHLTFWYGGGRGEFNSHYGYPDRMLGVGEMRLYLLMVLLGLPAGACFAQALSEFGWLQSFRLGQFFRSRRGLLVPAVLAALGSFVIVHFVTHYAWFTDDEQAYLLQAKLYSQGRLTAPVLEPRAVLAHSFVVEVQPKGGVPQWTGVYPVFQPFLMALSGFLGNLNLSQFLCVGLITYHSGRFAREWFKSDKVGSLAAWLCALSPLLLGLGATYHTSILGTTLSLFSARLLLWVLQNGGLGRGLALGTVAGSIVLARPLEGALVVSLVGAILVGNLGRRWFWFRGSRQTKPKTDPEDPANRRALSGALLGLVGLGLGGLVPLAVFVAVNLNITGNPLEGAYAVLERTIGRFIGFGNDMMWGRTHTPTLGVMQTVSSLVRVNAFAFGWPLSLALVAVSFARPFRSRATIVLLALSCLHLLAYFFLAFGSVHDFGHAYHVWHLPIIASLSAWVLVRGHGATDDVRSASEDEANSAKSDVDVEGLGAWLKRAVAAMMIVALSVFWPAQLTRWRDVSNLIWEPVLAAKEAAGGKPAIALWTAVQPPGTQRSWVFRPPTPKPDAQILWAYDSPGWYPYLKQHFPKRIFVKVTWKNGRAHAERVKL